MNKQQIKQILDNAPSWAIEVCQMGVGNNRFKFYDVDGRREEKLIALYDNVYPFTMSINCLRNQLALIEENEKLKAALELTLTPEQQDLVAPLVRDKANYLTDLFCKMGHKSFRGKDGRIPTNQDIENVKRRSEQYYEILPKLKGVDLLKELSND